MGETAADRTTAGFVAYEYATVQATPERADLLRDTYRNFGWTAEGGVVDEPRPGSVTLRFKRDRRIKNRDMVLELQRRCEQALGEIERLERSKTSTASAAAIGVGVAGSALLAGSIFSTNAGLVLPFLVLGVLGLIGWAVPWFLYRGIRTRQTRAADPQIERQYGVVHDTGERAARLLA